MKRDSFVLYTQWYSFISHLTDSGKAAILEGIFSVALDGKTKAYEENFAKLKDEEKGKVEMLMEVINRQMKEDGKKWEKTVAARREAGKASAASRAASAELYTDNMGAASEEAYFEEFLKRFEENSEHYAAQVFDLDEERAHLVRNCAIEAFNEWKLSQTQHTDYKDFCKHLLSTIRKKLNSF